MLGFALAVATNNRTFLGLTTDDWIAVGTLLLVLVTAVGVWAALISERRRTQPIVLTNAVGDRRFARDGEQALDVFLTNEGGGPAFNVRFGVEYTGVRFAWKYAQEDPGSGSRQRVMRPGERRPEGHEVHFEIPIPWARAALGREESEERRIYWCRYENAFGKMWETRNPWDKNADLDIHRVRLPKLRERREQRKRDMLIRTFDEDLQRDMETMLGTVEEGDSGPEQGQNS